MAPNALAGATSGVLFGAAVTTAGVYLPSIIVEQMNLRQFHMLKVFLTASATSTLIFAFCSQRYNIKPRGPSHLGWVAPYDGNIIGGVLLGAGMTVTGACPGTVFVQVGAGVPSAIPVLAGGAFGGLLYAKFGKSLQTKVASETPCDANSLTVPSKLNWNPNLVLLGFEALLLSGIAAAAELQSSPSNLTNPILGGLAIGASQLASVVLTGRPLGISAAFDEFGQWTWRFVDFVTGNSKESSALPNSSSLNFAAGVTLGAFAFAKAFPQPVSLYIIPISPSTAFLGSVMMIFGSRMAGGCTSGHGISGMSLFSLSSFYTVIAMFIGGFGLASVLH